MPTRTLSVLFLVEPKDGLRSAHEDRALDEIRLFDHQIDRFFLRLRQGTCLEDRTAGAHEIQEVIGLNMSLEKRPIRRLAVDVTRIDLGALLLQITSGVAAGRSGGLPIQSGL